jgi:hypothetical protein
VRPVLIDPWIFYLRKVFAICFRTTQTPGSVDVRAKGLAYNLGMTHRLIRLCATCARGVGGFSQQYRAFLLDPATLFTAASGILLLVAMVMNPREIISAHAEANFGHWLYLASAFVGSSFIWWSAVQGIRKGDFTTDIPVSLATLAAILIGQFAAAAVVAVLLLLGGMLENFVAARAGHALEELARLLPYRGYSSIIIAWNKIVNRTDILGMWLNRGFREEMETSINRGPRAIWERGIVPTGGFHLNNFRCISAAFPGEYVTPNGSYAR